MFLEIGGRMILIKWAIESFKIKKNNRFNHLVKFVVPVAYKESQMVIKNPHIESISGVKNLGR